MEYFAEKDAEELKAQYETSLSEAKEEAAKIYRNAVDKAESERTEIIRKSHEEAENIVAAASETIENERKRVIRQAHSEIADLAVEAASKIVGANLDDDFIEKIASLGKKYPKMQIQLMPYHRTGIEKARRLGLPPQEEFSVPDENLLSQIWEKIEANIQKA